MPPKKTKTSLKKTAVEYETADDSEYETEAETSTPKTGKRTSRATTKPKTRSRDDAKTKTVKIVEMVQPTPTKTLKLPVFSSREIDFWFIQVEALFRNGNVTNDQAKFDFVIAGLDPDICADIQDVLENPPQVDKYDFLKSRLRKRLSASDEKKIDRILDHTSLGDRTPSQFLRLLRKESRITDDRVLKGIWKKALPANVRLALAGRSQNLDELAEIADEIVDTDDSISAVKRDSRSHHNDRANAKSEPSISKTVETLAKTMEALAKEVREIKITRKQSPSRTQAPASGKCYFHETFGAGAKKCRDPCNYKPENANGQQ